MASDTPEGLNKPGDALGIAFMLLYSEIKYISVFFSPFMSSFLALMAILLLAFLNLIPECTKVYSLSIHQQAVTQKKNRQNATHIHLLINKNFHS